METNGRVEKKEDRETSKRRAARRHTDTKKFSFIFVPILVKRLEILAPHPFLISIDDILLSQCNLLGIFVSLFVAVLWYVTLFVIIYYKRRNRQRDKCKLPFLSSNLAGCMKPWHSFLSFTLAGRSSVIWHHLLFFFISREDSTTLIWCFPAPFPFPVCWYCIPSFNHTGDNTVPCLPPSPYICRRHFQPLFTTQYSSTVPWFCILTLYSLIHLLPWAPYADNCFFLLALYSKIHRLYFCNAFHPFAQ